MIPTLRTSYPFSTFPQFNRLDSLFDRLLNADAEGPRESVLSRPLPLSLWQDDNAIYLEVELPGVSENDVDITVHEGVLTVKAQKQDQEGRNYLHSSRAFGSFERSISLPEQVDSQKVEASLSSGVLRVVLPKLEQEKPRKIALKTS